MRQTIKSVMFGTASLSVLVSTAAFAQVANGAAPQAAVMDELVVTAQRRSESVQSVPVSLTAVGAAQLEAAVIDDVTDLKRVAPSFFAGAPPQAAGMRVNIRGLGSPGSVDPSVAAFVDGVYIARSGALLGNLFDIERVEVLNGPQGTLFGRNASVGALNISTGAPAFTSSGRATLDADSVGRARARLIVTGPFSDSLAGRLAIAYETFNGYGKNTLAGQDNDPGDQNTFNARGGLTLDHGPVKWTVRADYQTIKGDGIAMVTVDDATITPTAAANFAATTGGRAPRLTGQYDQVIAQQAGGVFTDKNRGLASDLALDLSGYTVRLISGLRDWRNHQDEQDVLYTAAPLLGRDVRFDSTTHSEELQLISPEEARLTYVAGLYYFDEDNGSQGQSNLQADYCNVLVGAAQRPTCRATFGTVYPAKGAGVWDMAQATRSYAGYGQGTYALTETLKFTLGGRYSRDEKTADILYTRPNPFLGTIVVPDAEALSATWSRFTYRVNASWSPTRDVMAFVTYSTGYKSGGFDLSTGLSAVADRTFQPELSDNYELGIKSQWLDRRITANATLFRMSVEDLQVRSYDAATNSFNTRNAGAVRQQGVELDLRARPAKGLTLGLAAAFLDSEYTSFHNAPPLPGQSGVQDLTGQRSSFSPRWQGVVSAGYGGQLTSQLMFSTDANLSFTSRQYVGGESDNNPQGQQAGYSVLGGRIAIHPQNDKWEMALSGENLTDKGYCVAKFTQPAAAAFGVIENGRAIQRCILGTPRIVRASMTLRF